jgi:hypothetical protein
MTLRTSNSCIAALAALLCATTASAQEKPRHGGAEGRLRLGRFQILQQLHPGPQGSRTVPSTEHAEPQRRVQVGVRTSHRPGGRPNQIANLGGSQP